MRAFLFLVVLLSTYYISAVFRSPSLLALCLAEGAMLIFLFLSVWILRARLRLSLGDRNGEAVRGMERPCAVRLENPSRLPAARLALRVSTRWMWEERGETFILYGGAEYGGSRLTFQLRAAHCGLLLVTLDRVRVYDWLNLFHASRNLEEELCLAVYPEAVPLRVRLAGSDWDGGERGTDVPGDDSGEVLKIREYQPGDPLRRVHWNQSARTDKLWMKEFPRDADRRVHVLLEPGSWHSPWLADGFWQVLYSLSLGLLDAVAAIRFHWLDGEDAAPRWFDAADVEQVRELFLTLYRAYPPETGKNRPETGKNRLETGNNSQKTGKNRQETRKTGAKKGNASPASGKAGPSPAAPSGAADPRLLAQIPDGGGFLRLTGDLRLYADGAEAVRFSAKGLTAQIRAAVLSAAP